MRVCGCVRVCEHPRGGDGGTVLLGADENAFKRALFGGDLAGQRWRLRRSLGLSRAREQNGGKKRTDGTTN